MRTNSNKPNGVVTAVLGVSDGSTGIWWYALTRSSFEKMVVPCREVVKSYVCYVGSSSSQRL